MPTFKEQFIRNRNFSFKGMRDTAMSCLPTDKVRLDQLYNKLKRGTDIIDDEDHLNMYLRSFGKMHQAKLNTAYKSYPNLGEIVSGEVEVFDWGCGQGIATICLLDFFKRERKTPKIKKVTLIEPSVPAVTRAKDIIKCICEDVEICVVNKVFDKLIEKDFVSNNLPKIHLFSNILDVDLFDLPKFISLFQKVFKGVNHFLCVGPYYSNSKRLDDFLIATDPDSVFANYDLNKGEWEGDWTISLRVFFKNFDRIESIHDIRKRIEESHKKSQFFAGYVLDAVSDEFVDTELEEENEGLLKSLSSFDVKSNKSLFVEKDYPSRLAVLANIISRGLPTMAPLAIENTFSKLFRISTKPKSSATIHYGSTHTLSKNDINEALHIIDPRFNIESYNGDVLESSFEKGFVENYLSGSSNEYLVQVLEPQRPLSTIVKIPNQKFSKDQRVDFAIEIPYGGAPTGFIFEVDGNQYHSNIVHRLRDELRDKVSSQMGWDIYRLDNLKNTHFISAWEQDASSNRYFSILKKNYGKQLSGSWRDTLQIVLSPLAIARVERMLLQSIITGELDTRKDCWNIVVVERDVPCAALAIQHFSELYHKMTELDGSNEKLPKINLTIVSTKDFESSPLHLTNKVNITIPDSHFDLCMDISLLLRDNVDAMPLAVDSETVYIIRSSHYKKKERTVCSANNIIYPEFVTKDTTGKYIDIEDRKETLTYFLREIFRKTSFRTGQLPILSHSLSDRTTIGLLPTGGGKSLTYQMSSMLQPGVTIVVDPLVSLMVDQVRGLRGIRIDSCDCVNSGMDVREKNKKLNLLQNGSLQFMLLSPERFMMENFRESLVAMSEKNNVYFSYGVIDEVHCVSEWGHDFRTSYLHLGRNMIDFMHTKSKRPLSIIGLTATASFDVLADVERELTLGGRLSIDSETIVRPENDTRPELTYRIIEVQSDFDKIRDRYNPLLLGIVSDRELQAVVAESKRKVMYRLLKKIPTDIESINSKNEAVECHLRDYTPVVFYQQDENNEYPNAGIVFCPHAHGQFGVEDSVWGNNPGVATGLLAETEGKLCIGTFIGGNDPSGDMKTFNQNQQNVMVATKAFGMGIDKPNIRFTIHINHPSSIEGYVQEAGRGGRDRKHAISYVLYDSTEFVHLTTDKINDIRWYMGETDDPVWLENYRNKFILWSDFHSLCDSVGCSQETYEKLSNVIRQCGFIENVDKNINLWFHNNSFRGLYKEKVILSEMTDRILNVKATVATRVQGELRETCGNDDFSLIVNQRKNSITIVSEEDRSKQYGYIFLDTLTPTYRFVNFEHSVCSSVSNNLINILSTYANHSATDLLKPLEGTDDVSEGIYKAMEKTDSEGYVFVTVSWENQIQQDYDQFEQSIKEEITSIAQTQEWQDLNPDNGTLKLNKVNDFDDLIAQIGRLSGDTHWLRNHANNDIYRKLRLLFCRKRDKDDTDKAIYRMCCVGLVEDVTIDYLSQTYELKIRKRTDEEYKKFMLDFFCKYYSLEQAEEKVAEIDNQRGRNYLDKCLGYLTGFVYASLEKKRYRAIEDMRIACEDSLNHRKNGVDDSWLKEFIHLYFNSKYARTDYRVGKELYSLSEDSNKKDGFDLVLKYLDVIPKDSSGSEVDNVKHLYGATLLCLRAHPENSALQLLLTYCITFLGTGENETLKTDALNSFYEGFMNMYKKDSSTVWDKIETFINRLSEKVHPEDMFIRDKIIRDGAQSIMLFVHEEQLNQIRNKYLNIK